MIRISERDSSAIIDETGAYLSSLSLSGKEIIKKSGDGEQTHGGCAVLIPYAGRIRNATYSYEGKTYMLPRNNGENSIHGLLKDKVWKVKSQEQNAVKLSSNLVDPGYPTAIDTTITYSLDGTSLTVTTQVTNSGSERAPLLIGFHPYFLFKGGWRISHDEDMRELNFRDGFFPDGTTEPVNFNSMEKMNEMNFDNCFAGGGKITLLSEEGKITLSRRNFEYLVIYNGAYSEGRSVAIEPMTGAPDAFNNGIGLIEVEPASSFLCEFSITYGE